MTDTRVIMENSKGTEEDSKFDGAFNSILHMDKKDYPNYVGGLMIASGHEFPIWSPIDSSIIFGRFQEPEEGLSDRAVEVAKDAFGKWSDLDPQKRAGYFEVILDDVTRQRYRLAAALTISTGMVRKEALYEVDVLIGVLASECAKIREGVEGKPQGVWAILSGHNSPLAAPIGYAVAAMLAGNTVVMIPSKYVPLPIHLMYGIFKAASLPDGVFNFIIDRREKSLMELANNLDVAGIVASGSGKALEDLMFMQADDEIDFINELKGMNPILVYKPSNMKEAARLVIESAFSYTGQRVDSTSKVIVTAAEQKQFVDAILQEAKGLVVGDPAEIETTVGPVISELAMKDFLVNVDLVRDNVIFGGSKVVNEITEAGYFVMPAIVMGLDPEHELNSFDSATPILSIQVVEGIDEAIEAVNDTEYGLSAGLISKDESLAERFLAEVQAEEIFINDSSRIIGPASKARVEYFLD